MGNTPSVPDNRPDNRPDNQPGDRLVRVGAIVFVIGALATVVTVAPLFTGADPLPSAGYLVCMLMGVGFAIAAAGVLRSISAQRRQANDLVHTPDRPRFSR